MRPSLWNKNWMSTFNALQIIFLWIMNHDKIRQGWLTMIIPLLSHEKPCFWMAYTLFKCLVYPCIPSFLEEDITWEGWQWAISFYPNPMKPWTTARISYYNILWYTLYIYSYIIYIVIYYILYIMYIMYIYIYILWDSMVPHDSECR